MMQAVPSLYRDAYNDQPVTTSALTLLGCTALAHGVYTGSRLSSIAGVTLLLIPPASRAPVERGAFEVGKGWQEALDLWPNWRAYIDHADLAAAMEPKELSIDECLKLSIYQETMRSRLFLFGEYRFLNETVSGGMRVRLEPESAHPAPLGRRMIREHARRVLKADGLMLASPFGAFLFASALLYRPAETMERVRKGWIEGRQCAFWASTRVEIDLPPEPADSHVTRDDILAIGPKLIGYRHVSTEEHAQNDATNGIPDGCALNLSFCNCESEYDTAKFKDLDVRVGRGEDCAALIGEYEQAITEFIAISVGMDLRDEATYNDLLATLSSTRFMLIQPRGSSSADVTGYGGLGRWPKSFIPADHVTLLPRLSLSLAPREGAKPMTQAEHKAFTRYIAAHYRRELLLHLRQPANLTRYKSLWRRA